MHQVDGKSPAGVAARTLTLRATERFVEIAITPDVNPDGGWAIMLERDKWQSFVHRCAAEREDGAEMESVWFGNVLNDQGEVVHVSMVVDLRDVPAIRPGRGQEVSQVVLGGAFVSIAENFERLRERWLRARGLR